MGVLFRDNDCPRLSRILNNTLKCKYSFYLGSNPTHARAPYLRKFAPYEWQNYFKFCFVRNPYDHAVSDYKWRIKSKGLTQQDVTFREYLLRLKGFNRPDPEG